MRQRDGSGLIFLTSIGVLVAVLVGARTGLLSEWATWLGGALGGAGAVVGLAERVLALRDRGRDDRSNAKDVAVRSAQVLRQLWSWVGHDSSEPRVLLAHFWNWYRESDPPKEVAEGHFDAAEKRLVELVPAAARLGRAESQAVVDATNALQDGFGFFQSVRHGLVNPENFMPNVDAEQFTQAAVAFARARDRLKELASAAGPI